MALIIPCVVFELLTRQMFVLRLKSKSIENCRNYCGTSVSFHVDLCGQFPAVTIIKCA